MGKQKPKKSKKPKKKEAVKDVDIATIKAKVENQKEKSELFGPRQYTEVDENG